MKTYIQKKIENILKENTGSHFLDSGGAYGRHHEKNANKKLDFSEGIHMDEYGATIPIHVYMDTMFELDDNTKRFNKLLSKDYHWVQDAIEELENRYELDFDSHLCSRDADNTYNSENDLSQDFQYQIFMYEGEYYCAFQLHNGCDIRGGYTTAQVFKVVDVDYFFIGLRCDFYDDSNGEQFESFYEIEQDERYEFNEDKKCFVNLETDAKIHPYSPALGF